MICITHIQMAGGERHEHIARLRWFDSHRDATTEGLLDEVVEWLREDPKNEIFVRQPRARSP